MDNRIYHIRISPEVINNDIFTVPYNAGTYIPDPIIDPCCDYTTTTTTYQITGYTTVYSSMTQILSGNTNGTSLLTGLTVPFFLTQNTVDMGYYSTFDGLVSQKDTLNNFIYSSTTSSPFTYYFYNTSKSSTLSYLQFTNYNVDWGDGSSIQTVNTISPNYYSHTYSSAGQYKISMSGANPWGVTIVQKTITVPYTDPSSLMPTTNDFIFTGDSYCFSGIQDTSNYTTVPYLITGFTKSRVSDLRVLGKKINLFGGYYIQGVQVTGTTGVVGTFYGPGPGSSNEYTAYTINNIDYYDYPNNKTLFVVESYGISDEFFVCSALTKEDVYINVIDQAQVQSNIFVDRGKNSGLETFQRLGEVDNIGDIEKYGYGFFKVINRNQ